MRAAAIEALVLVAAACQPATTPVPAPAAADAYHVVEVRDAGRIAGSVRWAGAAPVLAELPVLFDTDVCGTRKRDPRLVVGAGGGVADTVVSLTDITAGAALPAHDATVVQRRCELAPHVQIMAAGSLLVVRNEDPVLHEVRGTLGLATVLDFPQPLRGQRSEQRITAPGTIALASPDGAPWVDAVVRVTDHPYVAVTGTDGAFELDHVPPGTHRLVVWHEGWHGAAPVEGEREVTVAAGQVVTVELTLSDAGAR